VSLDFPPPLQQRVINALKADPKTIDLRAQAPHFYTLGARILDLFEDEDVVDVLLDVSLSPVLLHPFLDMPCCFHSATITEHRPRRSSSVPQRSPIMRIIPKALWVKERNSCVDWTRQKDSFSKRHMKAQRA